ncbi:MAG: uroporphyrinogen-III synthase [Bacteroidetes bacterium]|uniref:Uroporphyrinogen-III synthase n=1 Tax=Candidatus Cryptobacteroides excrementipullorum TaxID=2840761 RepID=A0A9D9NL06_9BACT|nr:uroporphyrinogen-III synthase [Candidatus Cryptobacteroides excrementipullorum]
MTVKNILISQQPPKAASPYSAITEKYGVNFDFIPFFTIEPLSSREFRAQRVNILDHSAIVFSARSTIDAFFRLCEELRVKIPETMKYFCTTEAVAMYLQKHIVYRKRKIFFGDGTASSVISQIGSKHKDETFLIATSDLAGNDITKAFQESGLKYESAIFVKSVSQDLKGTDLSSYDMIVLYNPSDVKSIYENYPDFKPGSTRFVAYGKSVLKAMDEAGLEVAVSAPTPEAPSVAKALELYLENNRG